MPGIGIGIYPGYVEDHAAEGDEVSSTYEGRHLTFPESSLAAPHALVQKGDPVVVHTAGGDIVGVAFNTALADTDLIAIDTEGIWLLEVLAEDDFDDSDIAVGDALYINDTQGICTISKRSDPEQNTLFGYALGSLTGGGVGIICVKVHWGPSEDRIVMGSDLNGGARYTEATSARPRVFIQSDYSGVAGIHRAVWVSAQMTDESGTNQSSLYGARYQVILPDGCTLTTVGHITAIHGYCQFYGICSDGAAGPTGAAGGVHSGVRGEIFSDGATFTGVRFINAVMATCNLGDIVSAGHYSAFMAYHVRTITDNLLPDSMFFAFGHFRNAIDLTGWIHAPAADDHVLLLGGGAEGRGWDASGTGNMGAAEAVNCYIRVEIDGTTGFVPVCTAAT